MVGLSITGGRRRHLLEGPREGTKAPVHRCVGDVNQVQCCALLGNLIIQVSFCHALAFLLAAGPPRSQSSPCFALLASTGISGHMRDPAEPF